MRSKVVALLLATVLVAAFATSGCGGGSATTASTDPGQVEASAQFLKDKDKEGRGYAQFGNESSVAVREKASQVLSQNLKARETGDFLTQCETLDAGTVQSYAGYSTLHGAAAFKACAERLKELARPFGQSADTRTDLLNGSIDALRVKGSSAYALFHGKDGKDHAMLMKEEDGEWKAASLLVIELS